MGKKKTSINQKTVSTDSRSLATEVISAAELSGIRLAQCVCNQSLEDNKLPDEMESKLLHMEGHIARNRKTVFLSFHFQILGTYKKTRREDVPPLTIQALYQSAYRINPDVDASDDEVVGILQSIGILNVWPYWREFIQSVTTRMDLPPLTLPLMNTSDAAHLLKQMFEDKGENASAKKPRAKTAKKKTTNRKKKKS